MDNIFKTFNKNFFKSVKNITWYDKQGIMPLDDYRIVIITLDDARTSDSYNGYWVEIVNKLNGSINRRFFRFIDHLTMIHKDENKFCHVWHNGDTLKWYISYPKDPKEMTDIIIDWIKNFK